jgi:glutathione S-transferase
MTQAKADFTLVVGNRNYSSWSLRAGYAMRLAGAAFDEVLIPLDQPDTQARIREHSGAGLVPVLHHHGAAPDGGDLTVWESLAICEYLAETMPQAGLWPDDPAVRALARAMAAEMHAGFAPLRRELPMNIRRRCPAAVPLSPKVERDVARIVALWRLARERHGAGGDFLCGSPGAVDAMFAPVASRFVTYAVALDPVAAAYVEAVTTAPAIADWMAAAVDEPWRNEGYESLYA